jgi:dTDP-glucose 4,6-dehydratase
MASGEAKANHMTKILITGGCGFIGHHLVEHVLRQTDWQLIIVDRLSYASEGFDRIRDIQAYDDRRVRLFTADLCGGLNEGLETELGEIDYVVHMAAETHVDQSIVDPLKFVQANVVGTAHLLEWARRQKNLKRLLYFGTDEVFGPAPDGVAYKEWDRYNSTNPYSATKAGGEELCLAWANTYGVPIITSHTMNVFGQRQHPEKFIPKVIQSVLGDAVVPIHADSKKTRAGSRFYIHARNVAAAVQFLLEKGATREKYNIVGEREIDNLSLAKFIAEVLGKPLRYELVDFHSSRPGHDLRYALDGSRLREMGWEHPRTFEQSLKKTIEWTVSPENLRWLKGSAQ